MLLAKRKKDPAKRKYDIIGGFLGWGERPEKGALREVLEETGLKIKLIDTLGIYINPSYRYQGETTKNLDIFYIGKIVSGKARAQDDVETLRWFSIKNPPKNIAFASVKKGLKDLQKWHKGHKKL